jgi:hypothetical protein
VEKYREAGVEKQAENRKLAWEIGKYRGVDAHVNPGMDKAWKQAEGAICSSLDPMDMPWYMSLPARPIREAISCGRAG